jgi:NRPS condensation-like uncharacterized protein
MIEQVRSYRTSDGNLHGDRAAALTHQYMLDIRGILQSKAGPQTPNFTATQAATIVTQEAEKFYKLTSKYREQIKRMQK